MNLAELIARETQEPIEAVMLLRHSNDSIERLHHCNATIEEYTAIQPIASKYDYHHPNRQPWISVVVVIVNDHVHQTYRVAGVDAEGTNHEVASEAYRTFDRDRPVRNCRRFRLLPIASVSTGLVVNGWEGRTRTPVQRHGNKFFAEVDVHLLAGQELREAVEKSFEVRVSASLRDTPAARMQRLMRAPRVPTRVSVMSFVFARNADVVAEALARASGVCGVCKQPAPFMKRTDQSPYLEVHHRVPLAMNGEDTIENAVALCPNCHRKAHYG